MDRLQLKPKQLIALIFWCAWGVGLVAQNVTINGTGTATLSDAPTLVGPVTVNGAIGSSAITLNGGTQTASFPVIDASQTWNNAGVTFNLLNFAATSTASAAASSFLNYSLVGTNNQVNISKLGTIALTSAGSVNNTLTFDNTNNHIIQNNSNALGISYRLVGDATGSGGPAAFRFGSTGTLEWNSATGLGSGSIDTTLARSAAGQVDIGSTASCSTASNCRDLRLRHLIASGTAPTIDTGCGTGTLATGSSDEAGKITANATGACTIVMTFGNAYARAPSCFVNNETTANLARATSTTTTVTLGGTTVTGDVLSYSCRGF